MIIVQIGDMLRLSPSEGYGYISDDETWTDCAYMPLDGEVTKWHDTNEPPPDPEEEDEPEEGLTELADLVDDAYKMANDLI